MGADGVFFTLVAPLIGTVLANVMFAAAMPAVLRVSGWRRPQDYATVKLPAKRSRLGPCRFARRGRSAA